MSTRLRRLRAALSRIAALFGKQRQERELSDEFESHLALEIAEGVRRGMTPQEARRRALIKLGGIEPAKEIYRDRRGLPLIETSLQDLRYGLRMLAKNPGFAVAAVMTLALGVAVNTTIFSLVNGILLNKPRIPEPDRVMVISSSNRQNPEAQQIAAPDYLDFAGASRAFGQLAAGTFRSATLTGAREPQWVTRMDVTPQYFRTLGIQPVLGRTFFAGEDQPGHAQVVVLSHVLWQSQFAADPAVIGKTISVDGERYTVIGVMPESFRLTTLDSALWTPLIFTPQQLGATGRSAQFLSVFGRLAPGVSAQQARAEMSALAKHLEEQYPATNNNRTVQVFSLQEFIIQNSNIRPALVLLMSTVVVVLLIACANIANLLLARNSVRRRELAIRSAIGAARWRLLRQLLIESLLLGFFGALVGLSLAVLATAILRSQFAANEYMQVMASQMPMDGTVLAFCFAISMFAAMFFGLLPALEASKLDLNAGVNEAARGASGGVKRRRMRSVLVVAEIALSIILLVGAGLLIQAILNETKWGVGFEPRNILTASLRVSGAKYEQAREKTAFFREAVAAAARLPGVAQASVTSSLPATASAGEIPFRMEGQGQTAQGRGPSARNYIVGPDYFRTMGIPLLMGRGFRASDNDRASAAVVVNQTLAQRYFANQNPVGRRVLIERGESAAATWSQIVGLVGSVRDFPGQFDSPQIYECYLQRPQDVMTIVVQTRSDPAAAAPALRQAIWSVDKDQPIGSIKTIAKAVADRSLGDRLIGWLMGSFAGLALVLAAVGIFGVIAYNVAQRTREIGIRMALGAGRQDVLRLVIGQSGLLTALGVALGLLGAFPIPKLLGSMFEELPIQPATTVAVVAALVAAVALAASYLPARRATRVEPMLALRNE